MAEEGGGKGGGGTPPSDEYKDAPKGYKTLSVMQRKDWNDFLDYLQKEGVGGKADLDKRDQTLGLSYLKKWNAANPDRAIDPSIIPNIQYEQYLLRKTDRFPGLKPEEIAFIKRGLRTASGTSPYLDREVSPVDGWLGSITSRLFYPTSYRSTNTGEKYDFGVNMEDYVRSLNNPDLAKKYLIQSK
jgi:hypothetical protein